MVHIFRTIVFIAALSFLSSCNYDFKKQISQVKDRVDGAQRKMIMSENYRQKSLMLARENRHLKAQLGRMRFEMQEVNSKYARLQARYKKRHGRIPSRLRIRRGIASIPAVNPKNDLVKYDLYKWSPDKILAIGKYAYGNKKYEKAAQYFKTLTKHYPEDKNINDQLLFMAGVASVESGNHDDWALNYFSRVMSDYPTSKYYRSAKLWTAMIKLKMGNKKNFVRTVREFKTKYRNTDEWKILRKHYEKIMHKYGTYM